MELFAEKCPRCDRVGKIENPVFTEAFKDRKWLLSNKAESAKPFGGVSVTCPTCHGDKYVLTAVGASFVESLPALFKITAFKVAIADGLSPLLAEGIRDLVRGEVNRQRVQEV